MESLGAEITCAVETGQCLAMAFITIEVEGFVLDAIDNFLFEEEASIFRNILIDEAPYDIRAEFPNFIVCETISPTVFRGLEDCSWLGTCPSSPILKNILMHQFNSEHLVCTHAGIGLFARAISEFSFGEKSLFGSTPGLSGGVNAIIRSVRSFLADFDGRVFGSKLFSYCAAFVERSEGRIKISLRVKYLRQSYPDMFAETRQLIVFTIPIGVSTTDFQILGPAEVYLRLKREFLKE